MKKIRGLIACLLVAVLVCSSFAFAEETSEHSNYIFVIDNSGSTDHDTQGGKMHATDPNNLRYTNLAHLYPRIADGSTVSVIVFSGEGKTTVYGPVIKKGDVNSEIQRGLNPENKSEERDNYTNITYALTKALECADAYNEGQSNIILLTDGMNDLTNSEEPRKDPQNLNADEETIGVVKEIYEKGYNFYVVALTSPLNDSSEFVDYMRRMGKEGGGVLVNDEYNNVFHINDTNIIGALLGVLGVSAGTVVGESIKDKTPCDLKVDVPYKGVIDVLISITYPVPERGDMNIDLVTIQKPSGDKTFEIWKEGARKDAPAWLEFDSDKNCFLITIKDPDAGIWNIHVEGDEGTEVTQTTMISHDVKLCLEADTTATTGDTIDFTARFQKGDGTYFDQAEASIYRDTEKAELTLTDGTNTKTIDLAPNVDATALVGTTTLDSPGNWSAALTVKNKYFERSVSGYGIAVLDPTPSPTPAPTPVPVVIDQVGFDHEAKEIDKVHIVSPEDGYVNIRCAAEGDWNNVEANVDGDKVNYTKETDGSLLFKYPEGKLENNKVYTFSIDMSNSDSGEAVSETAKFALYPNEIAINNLTVDDYYSKNDDGTFVVRSGNARVRWTTDASTDSIEKYIVNVGDTEQEVKNRSTACVVALPENEKDYTVSVKAVPVYGDAADYQGASINIHRADATFAEKLRENIVLIIIAIALLIGAGIAGYMIYDKKKPRLKGYIIFTCKKKNDDDFDAVYEDDWKFRDSGDWRYNNGDVVNKCKGLVKKYSGKTEVWNIIKDIRITMNHCVADGEIGDRHFDDETYYLDIVIPNGDDMLTVIDNDTQKQVCTVTTEDEYTLEFEYVH